MSYRFDLAANEYEELKYSTLKFLPHGKILKIEPTYVRAALCHSCKNPSIWIDKMIYPFDVEFSPNRDLAENIQQDFLEAASILDKSPRGAAALLRLCIQKLCKQLGEKGDDLNTDIGNLVKKGLSPKVQQALDIVRVIGNQAVHPGEMDIKDDIETAESLFNLVNIIAEHMLTEPKKIEVLFEQLPDAKKAQIKKRVNKV